MSNKNGVVLAPTAACPACTTAYQQCCMPLHQGTAIAQTPEALMRSRYSAYALGLYDYIVATYASAERANLTVEDIANSAAQTTWIALRVLDTKILPQTANDAGQFYGEVEFKVFYSETKRLYCLHERSTFIQEDGHWFYRDGAMLAGNGAVKYKRNDPCCCGSNKKFKQCCFLKIK
jgi:SEC-C motif-containing protein